MTKEEMTNAERIKALKEKEQNRKEIKIWGDGWEAGYDTGHKRGFNEGFAAALHMKIDDLKEIIKKLEEMKHDGK